VVAGRVQLSWELEPDRLVLRWLESGGPPTSSPVSEGFGIRMITASIERQLEGEARFDWRPQGLQCQLSVPRGENIEPMHRLGAKGAPRKLGDDQAALPVALKDGNRVLLVEDEILVALMMRDVLGELGFSVIGPFSRLSAAMVAAVHEDFDAGIIDVNLAGEFAYPVAEVLLARNIPFVFVTGYGVESIDRRFGAVPVIKKPVHRQVLERILVAPAREDAVVPGKHGGARQRLRRAGARS
jgi:CheY-like chemotaxis protein